MPPAHRQVEGWSVGYFLEEAQKIGQSTVRVIEILLKLTEHVEHGYRTARGIISLAKTYSGKQLPATELFGFVF
jgi:hypothetical protein